MGRRPATARSSVELMCDDFKRKSSRSERTLRYYREDLSVIIKSLERGGRETLPWKVSEEDVVWLLEDFADRNLAISTRQGYMSAFRMWTRYYDNDVMSKMEIRWPVDMRPNVDWITYEQAKKLIELPKTPAQELVVHCELCLGMRRVEVLRLKPDSFKGSHVEILGKGPMGGKPRSMPYHRDTAEIFDRYMRYRNSLIETTRMINPKVEVPESLLIWARGKNLHEYCKKGSGLDEMLKDLGAEIGVKFSNHTLRRTFGRTMYRSGVSVATISKMMGHESEEMTLKYIGVDLDDMADAMQVFTL